MPFQFPPPPIVAAAIAGSDKSFPVRRIFCVGRNYAAHAKEMGVQPDLEAPFYFTKSREALIPSGASLAYPPGTQSYHYEMELVVAIGADAFQIARQDALAIVFGYACGLDMTRRDLQLAAREQRRPWDLGKDFEQSAVLSPIVPVATCGHIQSGAISLSVNGEVRQGADISSMLHAVDAIIAHLSCYYRLQQGDLIFTGTPEGVGAVVPGDRIDGSIAGLGEISAAIVPPYAPALHASGA